MRWQLRKNNNPEIKQCGKNTWENERDKQLWIPGSKRLPVDNFFLSPLFPGIIKLQLDEEKMRERKERDGIRRWVMPDTNEVVVLSEARRGSFGLAMVV